MPPGTLDSGVSEVARFLAQRPPFDTLAPEELGELVTEATIEFHPAGARILSEDGGPVTFLRIVHSGGVDIAHDGRLLDLLGPGDTFGQAAMLAGLPPGFEARAAEDTLCYRIPVAAARPLLARARSGELAVSTREPAHQPVAELIRTATVTCTANATVSEVAGRMIDAGTSAAIVTFPDGSLGILTDRDLRGRVIAAGRSGETPVGEVATTPVFAVGPELLGSEALYEMLVRGIRHAPVVSDRGRLVGVVEDRDIFAGQARSWFGVRRTIERAHDLDELTDVAGRLPGLMLALHGSSLRALEIVRVLAALTDALACRALELALPPAELPRDGVVFVAVASQARRERTMTSDARGAFVTSEPLAPDALAALSGALQRCGLPGPHVARSGPDWARAAAAQDAFGLALLTDRRPLWGTPVEALPLVAPAADDGLIAALRAGALAHIPPTGFDADAVLGLDGQREERLDIRQAAIVPIVEMARWAAASAGAGPGSTLERLDAAAAAGTLESAAARTLADAFEVVLELRIAHQMEQLAAGQPPDDLLDPAAMSPVTRGHLRSVFRAVSGVQRELAR